MCPRQTIDLSFRGARISVRLASAYGDTRLLPGEREVFIALLTSYAGSLKNEQCDDGQKSATANLTPKKTLLRCRVAKTRIWRQP
ncbi:hypothetical protein CBM2591_A320135 [Cupriavidus taiwanensis]|nr:hypothetical protein CBM2591_A320135 [Cupriavidus taiwanensis]SPD44905.1 protein of unknown function [Cupriavidus taiwanensis]